MYKMAKNPFGALVLTSLVATAGVSHSAELIFEETFDDQPDWTSAMHSTDRTQVQGTHLVPDGWYSVRQDPTWAPSVGHDDRHEAIEILDANSHKARGGAGKSYVSWRDSYDAGWNRWNSDSILSQYFPEGYDQLYVEFYISFSHDWTPVGTSKIFRISSWNEEGEIYAYGGGRDNGPVFFYDYSHSGSYGVRNMLAFRGGPHGENYGFSDDDIEGFPRRLTSSGDVSMSFMNNFNDPVGDGKPPFILNKKTGEGSITELGRDPVHEELYGSGGTWTKLAFFVQMNSAPGVKDGSFMQWIDDELVIENHNVNWNKSNDNDTHVKWNRVDIGGNDFFSAHSNDDRVEEWYSIDDIRIYSGIPNQPGPPENITVTLD